MSKPNSLTIDEVRAVRTRTGVWKRDDHTFVRISGPDAASWLQTQTTNDVLALETGQGHANTVLDRQGRLQAAFTLHRWEDEYWMLVESAQWPHLYAHLDGHLFIEDVQITETGGELDQLAVQGPRTLAFLAGIMDTDEGLGSELLPRHLYGAHPAELLGIQALCFRLSLTGEDGYVFTVERGKGDVLLGAMLATDSDWAPALIGPDAQEILRIEAGIPAFGTDMDRDNRLPETTLERVAVSYDKGCYLGQEVVARLRTYGSVKQALTGLVMKGKDGLASLRAAMNPSADVVVDGKRIGKVTSACWSPTLNAVVGLAYLDREHRAPGTALAFAPEHGAASILAEVRLLPLYDAPSPGDRARILYDQALGLFERDMEDTDISAIPLLKEAVLLDPAFEDAYEALGVILNRHGRVDEAIHYMERLAGINPDCLMAHTNLSVFYVAKGMIQEAEEEKAKAAVLELRKVSDARAAKEAAESERSRLEKEARERIAMFEEVLEIDPDDPVATFGLGKAYVQLQDYESAIPHLRRATAVQKDFSAAYLDLGKCLEFAERAADAAEVYNEGIRVASRKGDLMPLREMERRLKALDTERLSSR